MKKCTLILALCAALLIGALTGCSGGENPSSSTSESSASEAASDTVTVEFFQQKTAEGPQLGYQQVIERFHEEYPNIRIEMNSVPDAGKVLMSRISSNDIPPIFSDYPTQMQFKQKVKNGFIEKLSGQDFLSRVNQPALEMSKADDGETYALPYSHNFMGVYYNIDIFDENGIKIPTTYEELITICETLKGNESILWYSPTKTPVLSVTCFRL